MKETIISLVALVSTILSPPPQPLLSPIPENFKVEVVLVEHQLDLSERNENSYTNEIFADNILLALDYFCRSPGSSILDTDTMCRVSGPFSFVLEPGEVFAFHENVAPEFADFPLKTGWTKYTAAEGYKSVGGLPGNGVCHLASLMNWTASDAGLEVVAKVNHNFAPVPGVPKEYGTSIKYLPNGGWNTQNQNLYIRNNFDFPVKFVFWTDIEMVKLTIIK